MQDDHLNALNKIGLLGHYLYKNVALATCHHSLLEPLTFGFYFDQKNVENKGESG